MKVFRSLVTVLAVFAPFLMIGMTLALVPSAMDRLSRFDGVDWMFLIPLSAMVLGLYYTLIYLVDENCIEQDFRVLDVNHDGFITRDEAKAWEPLARQFDRIDTDHDGRISRDQFEHFEHSLPTH